jgi:hypothetical protein
MNEIIVCISNEVTGGNLTLVKYNVIKRGRNPKFTNYIDSFSLNKRYWYRNVV